MDDRALEHRIRELTLLMYDTSVPVPLLEQRVYPFLAEAIFFRDPWLRARGRRRILTGLRGFHCVFHFDFVIHQLSVQRDEAAGTARGLVDGVMRLRDVPFARVFPLRTFLVWELETRPDGLQVTGLDELWSLADLVAALPLGAGHLYDEVFRRAGGAFFTAFFWTGCALLGRRAGMGRLRERLRAGGRDGAPGVRRGA